MKSKLSKLGRCAGFLALLLLLLLLASWLFTPKSNRQEFGMDYEKANAILSEPENTIDLLVVGDSEAYSSFIPMQLWQDYGITSYVCGTPKQKVNLSLRFLEQAFQRQSPRVVILETNAIFAENGVSDYLMSRAERYLPILRFHNHWKNIHWRDLCSGISYTWVNDYKGYVCSMNVQAADTSHYMTPSEEVGEIPSWTLVSLEQIQKLCEEHGAQLVLVSAPSTKNWSYAKHNGVLAYAEEHDLPYLDLNLMGEEVSIDWSADTQDRGDHLNHSGAAKVTAYLGQYLDELYELPDHRADPAYTPWEESLAAYQEEVARLTAGAASP